MRCRCDGIGLGCGMDERLAVFREDFANELRGKFCGKIEGL
jgi:hypothetical protein